MVGPLHDLTQLLGKADLGLACRDCRHHDTLPIDRVVTGFRRRGWPTGWQAAHARFRCSRCDSKAVILSADFYGYSLRHQVDRPGHLRPVPATLRPGLRPPPPGVSIEAWNAADDRGRKRLADRARG